MRYFLISLILAALIAVGLAAQAPPPAPPVDVEKIGPKVGETVPDFSAPDQSGRQQTLKSIMGPNGAMISFNRSADW